MHNLSKCIEGFNIFVCKMHSNQEDLIAGIALKICLRYISKQFLGVMFGAMYGAVFGSVFGEVFGAVFFKRLGKSLE